MAATKLTDKLTNIADAIREKTGGTDALTLDGMAQAIEGISAGGGGLDEGITSTFGHVVSGSFTLAATGTATIFNGESHIEVCGERLSDTEGFGICFCLGDHNGVTGYTVVPSFTSGIAYKTKVANGGYSGVSGSGDLGLTNGSVTWKVWSALGGVTYYWVLFAK